MIPTTGPCAFYISPCRPYGTITQVRGFAPTCREPQGRAIGMLEQWNNGFWDDGMVGLENQNEYNCIDFLVIVAYFLGRKQKMDV
jgi:hypothetical protein